MGRRPFVARRRGYQVDRALTVLDQWMEDAALLELGDKLTESRPKTGAGERRIYLGPETSALLRAHRKAQVLERQVPGAAWQDNAPIFRRADGMPWRPDTCPSGSGRWLPRSACHPSSSTQPSTPRSP